MSEDRVIHGVYFISAGFVHMDALEKNQVRGLDNKYRNQTIKYCNVNAHFCFYNNYSIVIGQFM